MDKVMNKLKELEKRMDAIEDKLKEDNDPNEMSVFEPPELMSEKPLKGNFDVLKVAKRIHEKNASKDKPIDSKGIIPVCSGR